MEDNTQRIRNVFEKHAASYRDRFWDVSQYAASLRFFCGKMEQGAPILEIGCGPGNVTSFLLGERPDLRILATDFAPGMVAIARRENPSAETLVLDAKDLGNIERRFQGVVCAFVLPYLDDMEVETLFSDASSMLEPSGQLYVSSMIANASQRSGVRVNSYGDAVYMHYHERDILRDCLRAYGFRILFDEVVEYPAGDGTTTSDLMIVAEKS